jgi:merozoite surface antigen 2c
MLKTKIAVLSVISMGLFGNVAFSQESPPTVSIIDSDAIAQIREWLKKPVVEISINAQNKRYASIPQEEIDALDKQWRAERKSEDQPLIAATLSSPLSNYLTQIQAGSGGLFTEIFVMDAKGLNVGQSSITSDFWQGDEGKFQKTFPNGADAVFVDEAELNEGTKTWRAQVNLTIANAENQPIGAVTVEYNLTELARRRAAF